MSKSRDLFLASGICVFGVLLIASNFADRFVQNFHKMLR